MSAVERVRVGDVLKLERRQVYVEPASEYDEIGIRSFGRGIFHKEPSSGVTLGNKRVFRIEPGDLVISNVFGWEGAIAVASGAEAGKIGSHRFMTFTPVDDGIDTSWAAWFFLSEPGLALIREASPGSAGRNRTLAVKRFEDLVIPLPPIEEQRRAAARLSHVAAVSEELLHLVDRSRVLVNATRASLTAPQVHMDGWPEVGLGEFLRPSEGGEPVYATESYPVAGVYSFGRGLFERGFIAGDQTSYKTLNRLSGGQLVMSRLKAWEGALALVDDRFDGWYLSPEFPTFGVDDDAVDREFLRAVVTSEPFWRRLGGKSKGIGARRERVSAERLLQQTISLPPISVQHAIAKSLVRLSQVEAHHRGVNARAQAVVPALLNQTFASLA